MTREPASFLHRRVNRRALFAGSGITLGAAVVLAFTRGTGPSDDRMVYAIPDSVPTSHTDAPNCACPRCTRFDGPRRDA